MDRPRASCCVERRRSVHSPRSTNTIGRHMWYEDGGFSAAKARGVLILLWTIDRRLWTETVDWEEKCPAVKLPRGLSTRRIRTGDVSPRSGSTARLEEIQRPFDLSVVGKCASSENSPTRRKAVLKLLPLNLPLL